MVTFSDPIFKALSAEADAQGTSPESLIRKFVEDALNNLSQEKAAGKEIKKDFRCAQCEGVFAFKFLARNTPFCTWCAQHSSVEAFGMTAKEAGGLIDRIDSDDDLAKWLRRMDRYGDEA